MADGAVRDMQPLRAAQRHVLADRGDGVGDGFGDRAAAGVMGGLDRFHLDGGALVERDRENAAHERLEVVVAGDEIGFRVHLDDDAEISLDGDADEAVGGDAAALLGRLGEALLAQPVDGRFDVAAGFAERVLAVHHARAGLLAQVLHQRGGNRGHWLSLGIEANGVAERARALSDRGRWPGPEGRRPALTALSRARGGNHAAAMSERACSTQLSLAMRPLNLRSASSLSASSLVIAATCQ